MFYYEIEINDRKTILITATHANPATSIQTVLVLYDMPVSYALVGSPIWLAVEESDAQPASLSSNPLMLKYGS